MDTFRTLSLIGAALSHDLGWSWPWFLLRSLRRGAAVFRATRWAAPDAPAGEARYTRRLALAAALYLGLTERLGPERALEVMRRILVPLGYATIRQAYDSFHLSHLSGMARLLAFRSNMEEREEDRYNTREYLASDDTTCHYVITRCLVHEFFTEAGTPALTKLICAADEAFYPQAFPDFTFSRGDSWENTIAYGKDRCEYILVHKESGSG